MAFYLLRTGRFALKLGKKKPDLKRSGKFNREFLRLGGRMELPLQSHLLGHCALKSCGVTYVF
jgi:hypothetical protein